MATGTTFTMQEVALRVKLAMVKQGLTQLKLAEKSKVPNSTISSLLRGATADVRVSTIKQLAAALNVPINYLLLGGELPSANDGTQAQRIKEETVLIAKCDIKVAAGNGTPEPTYEDINDVEPVEYTKNHLLDLGANPACCRLLKARGDSMQPQIHDGDDILVDTSKKEVVDGRIYAIFDCVKGGLRVKRLRYMGRRGLAIISDNPDYGEELYTPEEAVQIMVIGQVLERSGAVS